MKIFQFNDSCLQTTGREIHFFSFLFHVLLCVDILYCFVLLMFVTENLKFQTTVVLKLCIPDHPLFSCCFFLVDIVAETAM